MSDVSDALVDAVRELQGQQDNPCFNWNGQDYRCASGANIFSRNLGAGGFSTDYDLQLAIVLSDFPPGPNPQGPPLYPGAKKDVVFFPGPGAVNGIRYRVGHTVAGPGASIAVLGLIDDSKGS